MSKPKTSAAQQPASYSPAGCIKPVSTYLSETEVVRIKSLAAKEMRSQAATVRILILQGLERYESKME